LSHPGQGLLVGFGLDPEDDHVGKPFPVAASTASGRGVRKKTKDLPPTWYTALPRAPETTVTCGSPSASSCTSSARACRSAVTPGSLGADPVAMQDGGQRVGLANDNPTHPPGHQRRAVGPADPADTTTKSRCPENASTDQPDRTPGVCQPRQQGPCDQQRPMASACTADRSNTARPRMLWPEVRAYWLVMRRHSRGCLHNARLAQKESSRASNSA
jgi:hypothetical protein